MPAPRLNKIEIQGFRSFGAKPQTLVFSSSIAAVWGANSQGKTSLAEAFEFLLTGAIVRREMLASTKDEFADALRNAHIPAKTPVFVRAEITDSDGTVHTVTRKLVADYGMRRDCEAMLEIDGKQAAEKDLGALGIVLSQPPLRAPVLAQHTLSYLFSARPQDRATYFKALLEVADLDSFRTIVAGLDTSLKTPDLPILHQLTTAVGIPEAAPALTPLTVKIPTPDQIAQACASATAALVAAAGEAVPADTDARLARIQEILADKRAKTFPIETFEKRPIGTWAAPGQDLIDALAAYVAERTKIDQETRRLAKLFTEALALPAVAGAVVPIDCPLCASPAGLTPHRISHIRKSLQATDSFRTAEKTARKALPKIAAALESARSVIDDPVPRFMLMTPKARRSCSFSLQRIRDLLGPAGAPAIAGWLPAQRRLARALDHAQRIAAACRRDIESYSSDVESLADAAHIQGQLAALAGAIQALSAELPLYLAAEKPVAEPLKAVVDTASKTTGWQELVAIATDQHALRAALIEADVYDQARKELEQALRQIERANAAVLDTKFQALSDSIRDWWNLLRPNETSFFAAVWQRAGTVRTIDFKAGLSAKLDRSEPKLRDVIAVFSQSQLHCLGLALFLARTIHEGGSTIVLDDPILSSDEDYRAFFNTAVLEKLIDSDVQVILLTQDQRSWKDVGSLYLHKNIALFQLSMMDPADGTVIWNTADDLKGKLLRLETLVRNTHPTIRKKAGEDLRDAAERFCKEMLVKGRRAKGEKTAVISEYDGKNLGWLSPRVEPLLSQDPSHPGKLKAIASAVNPANHDDNVPSQGALTVALGDLTRYVKDYLGN